MRCAWNFCWSCILLLYITFWRSASLRGGCCGDMWSMRSTPQYIAYSLVGNTELSSFHLILYSVRYDLFYYITTVFQGSDIFLLWSPSALFSISVSIYILHLYLCPLSLSISTSFIYISYFTCLLCLCLCIHLCPPSMSFVLVYILHSYLHSLFHLHSLSPSSSSIYILHLHLRPLWNFS